MSNVFYACEFCKCSTNAYLRCCCEKGKAADLNPVKATQVIEKEHGASRSRFLCMRPAAFVIDCETDDSECCTKALRAVSGSENAIHPRDWSTRQCANINGLPSSFGNDD